MILCFYCLLFSLLSTSLPPAQLKAYAHHNGPVEAVIPQLLCSVIEDAPVGTRQDRDLSPLSTSGQDKEQPRANVLRLVLAVLACTATLCPLST